MVTQNYNIPYQVEIVDVTGRLVLDNCCYTLQHLNIVSTLPTFDINIDSLVEIMGNGISTKICHIKSTFCNTCSLIFITIQDLISQKKKLILLSHLIVAVCLMFPCFISFSLLATWFLIV